MTPPQRPNRLRIFAWVLLAGFGAAPGVFTALPGRVPFVAVYGCELAAMGLFVLLCIGVPFARSDPLGFGSIVVPAFLLALGSILTSGITQPWLILAGWIYLAVFVFGGQGLWRPWSRIVLHRHGTRDNRARRARVEVR